MNTETYEILALAARYWFIMLAGLIVYRGWRASVRANRGAKVLRDWAGGAGCVGELVVLEDGSRSKKKTLRGARIPVPAEALVGSGGTADIRIRHSDVKRKHVWLNYQPGRMLLVPVGKAEVGCPVLPDGRPVLRDGDSLIIGKLKMMMVFYDVKDAAAAPDAFEGKRRPETPEEEFEDPFEEKFWE